MQDLHEVLECDGESWYCPITQELHDPCAFVEQYINFLPLPHVEMQLLHEVMACEVESWYFAEPQAVQVRCAVVVQALNAVPDPHVVAQLLQTLPFL